MTVTVSEKRKTERGKDKQTERLVRAGEKRPFNDAKSIEQK